jgi:hypothetical protein
VYVGRTVAEEKMERREAEERQGRRGWSLAEEEERRVMVC